MHRDELIDKAEALRERGEAKQAIEALAEYADANTDDGDVALIMARLHDSIGQERAAIPYYEHALASDLVPEDYLAAGIGLGSSLRALGEFERAVSVLEGVHARHPENRAVETFLAMAKFNAGSEQEAFETLLRILAEASSNQQIRAYAGALTFYAEDIAATWP